MKPLLLSAMITALTLLCCFPLNASELETTTVDAGSVRSAVDAWPNVLVQRGTCNVYALRDGDSAILINIGDGSVLRQLKQMGVNNIEWVLFTDHHREQCQGAHLMDRSQTKVAAPKDEQALFESPLQFRKWRPQLNDQYTVHGASYVRPPSYAIKLDRGLAANEVFTWRGYEITCVSTPGTSPGGMSYVLREGDRACAFTGGVIHDGARMTNWYDTEWDYGFAKGLDALTESVQRLRELKLTCFPHKAPRLKTPANNSTPTTRSSLRFAPITCAGIPSTI